MDFNVGEAWARIRDNVSQLISYIESSKETTQAHDIIHLVMQQCHKQVFTRREMKVILADPTLSYLLQERDRMYAYALEAIIPYLKGKYFNQIQVYGGRDFSSELKGLNLKITPSSAYYSNGKIALTPTSQNQDFQTFSKDNLVYFIQCHHDAGGLTASMSKELKSDYHITYTPLIIVNTVPGQVIDMASLVYNFYTKRADVHRVEGPWIKNGLLQDHIFAKDFEIPILNIKPSGVLDEDLSVSWGVFTSSMVKSNS
jgi:hypothetical protein